MVKVLVPATTANLGPGFDTLGMALEFMNTVEMAERESGLVIEVEGEGADTLPRDSSNLVYRSAEKLFEAVGFRPAGLWIKMNNQIPLARGLGSSSAAIIGGLVAANELSGRHLCGDAILALANEIEGHPDNITPAFIGGMTVSCLTGSKVNYIKTSFPAELKAVVAVPEFQLSTEEARRALPREVTLKDAVYNVSRASLLVAAVVTGQLDLLQVAMEDKLHQPYRSKLIPGLDKVFEAAKAAGAKGVVISGSGPSVIAFTTGDGQSIGRAMAEAFGASGVKCRVINTAISRCGATIAENRDTQENVAS